MHRDEWDDEDGEPKWAGAPLTTKEKDMLRYYYYIHNGIDTRYIYRIFTHNTNLSSILITAFDFFMNLFDSLSFFRYVANINQKWFKRIMMMVPKKLLKNQQEIKKIHEEIKDDYLFAVKKSIVDFVMHEPEIDEDER